MAKMPTLLLLCCLTNLILAIHNVLVNSSALTFRLIHPHSPESPFFTSNMTSEDRIRSSILQSNVRAHYLARASPPGLQMQINMQLFLYIVKVSIGTFKTQPPYKEYFLEMDTGSSLVWLQCEGCTKCFKQTPKPFPKQDSSSFHPLFINNKSAFYQCLYADGDSTQGILATETFYLKSNTGRLARAENVEFGCGLHNVMRYGNYKDNRIAGIMGLGSDDLSFVRQLGPLIKGRFSYCLPLLSSRTPSTYLRFGYDRLQPKDARSTPMDSKKGKFGYFIELQGISINKTRLNINPKVFAFASNGSSEGCIIDTGAPYSRLVSPAFDVLKQELEKYFSKFKNFKRFKGNLGLELCYMWNKSEGFSRLPSITFHFRGSRADFVMKAEAVFDDNWLRGCFCLAMLRDAKMSILGSHQQTNHRIIYDTSNKKLVFYPQDCSKNP